MTTVKDQIQDISTQIFGNRDLRDISPECQGPLETLSIFCLLEVSVEKESVAIDRLSAIDSYVQSGGFSTDWSYTVDSITRKVTNLEALQQTNSRNWLEIWGPLAVENAKRYVDTTALILATIPPPKPGPGLG